MQMEMTSEEDEIAWCPQHPDIGVVPGAACLMCTAAKRKAATKKPKVAVKSCKVHAWHAGVVQDHMPDCLCAHLRQTRGLQEEERAVAG